MWLCRHWHRPNGNENQTFKRKVIFKLGILNNFMFDIVASNACNGSNGIMTKTNDNRHYIWNKILFYFIRFRLQMVMIPAVRILRIRIFRFLISCEKPNAKHNTKEWQRWTKSAENRYAAEQNRSIQEKRTNEFNRPRIMYLILVDAIGSDR